MSDIVKRLHRNFRLAQVAWGVAPDVDEPPAKRRRGPWRLTLPRAKKLASKAGITDPTFTLHPDGAITVAAGEPTDADTGNPWDKVLTNGPH